MPRHGGSNGRWVTKSSGKTTNRRGRGRGQVRNAPLPASSATFPQITVDFKTGTRPIGPVDPGVVLRRRKHNREKRRQTLQG